MGGAGSGGRSASFLSYYIRGGRGCTEGVYDRRRGWEGGRECECELSDGGVDVSIDPETDFEASFGVGPEGDSGLGGGREEKLNKVRFLMKEKRGRSGD